MFDVDQNVPKYLHSQELSQNILIKTAQVSVRTHNTVTSAHVDKVKAGYVDSTHRINIDTSMYMYVHT